MGSIRERKREKILLHSHFNTLTNDQVGQYCSSPIRAYDEVCFHHLHPVVFVLLTAVQSHVGQAAGGAPADCPTA